MGGKKASTAAARPSTEPVTKRVHVGNLAPSVTAKDLVQRFSSFGTVIDGEHGVQGLGKTDTGAFPLLLLSHLRGQAERDAVQQQELLARLHSSRSRRQTLNSPGVSYEHCCVP